MAESTDSPCGAASRAERVQVDSPAPETGWRTDGWLRCTYAQGGAGGPGAAPRAEHNFQRGEAPQISRAERGALGHLQQEEGRRAGFQGCRRAESQPGVQGATSCPASAVKTTWAPRLTSSRDRKGQPTGVQGGREGGWQWALIRGLGRRGLENPRGPSLQRGGCCGRDWNPLLRPGEARGVWPGGPPGSSRSGFWLMLRRLATAKRGWEEAHGPRHRPAQATGHLPGGTGSGCCSHRGSLLLST